MSSEFLKTVPVIFIYYWLNQQIKLTFNGRLNFVYIPKLIMLGTWALIFYYWGPKHEALLVCRKIFPTVFDVFSKFLNKAINVIWLLVLHILQSCY